MCLLERKSEREKQWRITDKKKRMKLILREKKTREKKKLEVNFVETPTMQDRQTQQNMSRLLLQENPQIIKILVVWVLLSLLLLPVSTSANASQEFENLQNEFTEWKMGKYPYHFKHLKQTYKLNSYSLKGYKEEKDKINEFLTKLKQISRSNLQDNDVLFYDIMKQMLEQKLNGYEWHLYGALSPLTFLERVITPLNLLAPDTNHDEKYIRNMLKLIGDINRLLEEYKTLMREAIIMGHTLHNVSIIPVYETLLNLSENEPYSDSFGVKQLNKYINQLNVSTDHKNELKSLVNTTIESVRLSYDSMAQFLKNEYLPNTRPHISISSLPNGRRLYDDYLKWHLSISMSADELHNLGRHEIARIHDQMKKIMDKHKFNGTIQDYFKSLSKRPEFFLKTKEDIINRYKLLIEKIKDKLNATFRDYPDLPMDIRPMSYDGPAALYIDGSKSENKRGSFILNLYRPQEMPTYEMMALALHEAVPGHHLQRSYLHVSDLPFWKSHSIVDDYFLVPFQFPFNTAYIEGWALYSEYLGEEMGLYETDYDLMGRYSFEIFRACRLVIDTGIHSKNMTREEGIQLLMMYTGTSLANAEIEIDRYITIPGQACAYKIGEIKILQLRKKAEKALGASFAIKDFHDTILRTGSVPLEVLEHRIDEMIICNSATNTLAHLTLLCQFLYILLH